ncbi:MAG: MBL fold metallo-hydrolase [Fibrobacter sp.]|nr:MBL fold metallo-hydrolase [Fibrobacter sp.]
MRGFKCFEWIQKWRVRIALGFVLGVFGCTYVSGDDGDGDGPLRLTVLNVGQGLAVLLEYGGRYALYDTGPDSVGVTDSLLARGVDTLEWVLLSHYHRDHCGGFMEMLPRVHVGRLFVGSDTAVGFVRDSVFGLVRRFGIPVDTLVRGDNLALEGPRFEVLWPPEYWRVGENGASVVLRVEFGEGSALLTGDLDSARERSLLELSPTLAADLLQVPHHGSAGSSTMRFLSQLAPDFAVVGVGAHNRYGHPARSVVQKLNYVLDDSTKLYRTDLHGSVDFEIHRDLGVLKP